MTTKVEEFVVTPMTGALGARIEGIDLSRPLSPATAQALRDTISAYCVLIFTGQPELTAQQQTAFGKMWGELITMPDEVDLVEDNGELFLVKTQPTDENPRWHSDWHSDWTFLERPPFVSILAAKKLPEIGGDTMWANQYLAYETLSPKLRSILDGLRAVHSRHKGQAASGVHPAVRTIPETGRRALYVNEFYTSNFEGMTVEESAGLLKFLTDHATQPNFTFRHRWSLGDVAVWDNRCVQHYAVADYTQEREMHRLTIVGEVPVFV